jgi:hypothetical protein
MSMKRDEEIVSGLSAEKSSFRESFPLINNYYYRTLDVKRKDGWSCSCARAKNIVKRISIYFVFSQQVRSAQK